MKNLFTLLYIFLFVYIANAELKIVHEWTKTPFKSVKILNCDTLLLAQKFDSLVILNAGDGSYVEAFYHKHFVRKYEFHYDDDMLITLSDSNVSVIDFATKETIFEYNVNTKNDSTKYAKITDFAFNKNENKLYITTKGGKVNEKIIVCDINKRIVTRELLVRDSIQKTIPNTLYNIEQIHYSSSNNYFVYKIRVFMYNAIDEVSYCFLVISDTNHSDKFIKSIPINSSGNIAISPDGNYISYFTLSPNPKDPARKMSIEILDLRDLKVKKEIITSSEELYSSSFKDNTQLNESDNPLLEIHRIDKQNVFLISYFSPNILELNKKMNNGFSYDPYTTSGPYEVYKYRIENLTKIENEREVKNLIVNNDEIIFDNQEYLIGSIYRISDINGKMLREDTLSEAKINVSQFKNGVYFLMFTLNQNVENNFICKFIN